MEKNAKIYIAGHQGMVGSSIHRSLLSEGYNNIVVRSSKELDLRIQSDVKRFFEKEKPEYVFLAAAKVGGISANSSYPEDFLYDNLMIQLNVIQSSYLNGVKKLLNFNTGIIYNDSELTSDENELDSFIISDSHIGYKLSKISSLYYIRYINSKFNLNYVNLICSNIYGPNDKFNLDNSNVIAALITKIKRATDISSDFVSLLGDGTQVRDFIYCDDVASAAILIAKSQLEFSEINISTSLPTTINLLAQTISEILGFKGDFKYSMSNFGKQKILLNNSRLVSLGWVQQYNLRKGLEETIKHYLNSGHLI